MVRVRHWAALTIGRAKPADDQQRRYTNLIQSVLSGLASRVVGVVVSIISVPLTIGYLGTERYGVWVTIGTFLAWLQLADFGVGNGLTNALATAYGNNRPDLARHYVTTSLVMLSAVTLLIGGACAIAWPWINWGDIFSVQSPQTLAEIGPAMAVSLVIFLASFPLSLINKVYNAYQEGRIANYWGAVGNLASLLAIVLVTQTQGGLVWLVLAVSGAGLVMQILSGAWLFIWHKRWLMPHPSAIKGSALKELGHTGGMFFVVQITSLLIFQTDNVIIAHFASAAEVTPYSVTYRLFGYTTLLQALLFPNLWPAYAEAIAKKDIAWVRRTLRASTLYGTLATVILCIPLTLFGSTIISVWTRHQVTPPFSLLAWMALWSVINAAMNATVCILSASGRIRNQMIYALFTAVANIAITLWLIGPFGITGVIAGTVLAYLVFAVVPQFIDTGLLMRKLSTILADDTSGRAVPSGAVESSIGAQR
jgi:O-antigen/teichoic acid export membrane protein